MPEFRLPLPEVIIYVQGETSLTKKERRHQPRLPVNEIDEKLALEDQAIAKGIAHSLSQLRELPQKTRHNLRVNNGIATIETLAGELCALRIPYGMSGKSVIAACNGYERLNQEQAQKVQEEMILSQPQKPPRLIGLLSFIGGFAAKFRPTH